MKKSQKIKYKQEIIALIVVIILYLLVSDTAYDFPGNLTKMIFGHEIYGWIIVYIFLAAGLSDSAIKTAFLDKEIDKEVNESSADELKKWVELRDTGAITEEEFQKKKDELIK